MVLNEQPLENNYLQPVCITVGDYTAGETAWVIGWGTLTEGKKYVKLLTLNRSRFQISDLDLLL